MLLVSETKGAVEILECWIFQNSSLDRIIIQLKKGCIRLDVGMGSNDGDTPLMH
jgi:hypothetical protein